MTLAQHESAPRAVTSLQELVHLCDLRQIITYALHAERNSNDIESMDDAQQVLEAQVRYDGMSLETRFALDFHAPNVVYRADIGGVFEMVEPLDLAQDLIADFMSQVGLMSVFPYLREAITGLGARLGAPAPVIGLIRRGDVQFSPDSQVLDEPNDTEVP